MLLRFLLIFGVVGGLSGMTLLGINAYLSRASLWAPLTLSIPQKAGGVVSGGFVSQIDGILELEIELPLEMPLAARVDPLKVFSGAGAVALEWQVHSDGRSFAQGNSESPLYLGRRFANFRNVLRSVIFGSPLIADRSLGNLFGLLTRPAVVSGVGRFRAESEVEYLVGVRTDELGPMAVGAEPILRVRARRQNWKAAENQIVAFGYAGKYVLAITALTLCVGFVLILVNRRGSA